MANTYYSHLRKVTRGTVTFDGRKYRHVALKEYEGQTVDIDTADLKDLTKRKIYTREGKFICEATMKELGNDRT
jgi:hypothetical protein